MSIAFQKALGAFIARVAENHLSPRPLFASDQTEKNFQSRMSWLRALRSSAILHAIWVSLFDVLGCPLGTRVSLGAVLMLSMGQFGKDNAMFEEAITQASPRQVPSSPIRLLGISGHIQLTSILLGEQCRRWGDGIWARPITIVAA